ncbi:MAG: hypothetical protein R2813_03915 [Flavobacteriales bacterium]
MRFHFTICTAVVLLTGSQLHAQLDLTEQELTSFKLDGKQYLAPTLANLFKCVELSTKDWETEMKKFDFSDRGFQRGCTYYGSGADLSSIDGLYVTEKCPGDIISLQWSSFGDNNKSLFDDITYQLEPYFVETTEDNWNIYRIKFDETIGYLFRIHRENSFEVIFLHKVKLDSSSE